MIIFIIFKPTAIENTIENHHLLQQNDQHNSFSAISPTFQVLTSSDANRVLLTMCIRRDMPFIASFHAGPRQFGVCGMIGSKSRL
jgi:hypothetical protein